MYNGWSISSTFPKCVTIFIYVWTAYISITRVKVVPFELLLVLIICTVSLGIYTYSEVISVGPGSPIDFPDLAIKNLHDVEMGAELPPEYLTSRSLTMKHDGRFRICQTCMFWKPDRCHHCSSCNRCILKMDHHCPWFAECIGFKNQKYFIQFLFYCTSYSIIVLFVTSIQIYHWFRSTSYEYEFIDFKLLTVWLLAIVIFISLVLFTGFSVFQLLGNQTTIELYAYRRYKAELNIIGDLDGSENINIFDLGSRYENWKDVMGNSWLEWLLPIETYKSKRSKNTLDEKGLFFAVNLGINGRLLNNIGLQDRLFRRLAARPSTESTRPFIEDF
ncbi:hypothetical protein KAFR_0A08590 [Kazachstania africana CBS 2517]|uniref:Palmitoyltransferase n=1 Tax=Kazachstania africana (strain ATCC 22294 / BCRC 22015 / CBS 2517 / CECT 1963 / NBRC 1671 / NRRL Y-8276) TaxID=1071382 RepID=H2APJ3_KAZAF|nr:hypothetical protein KAFR_0A08590 [Kazachstania africana CBS 2517]CCF56293.1 hypothetical protein KAFR_0A08590 [Kazachstania africana CBS 2517]